MRPPGRFEPPMGFCYRAVMAYITTGDVDSAISTATRQALAPNTAAFAQHEVFARESVKAAAEIAGQSLPATALEGSLFDDRIKLVTIGQWYVYAGGLRKGLEPPAGILESVAMLNDVRDGKIRLASQSSQDGIAGVKFSSTSTSGSTGRPQWFSRSSLRKW